MPKIKKLIVEDKRTECSIYDIFEKRSLQEAIKKLNEFDQDNTPFEEMDDKFKKFEVEYYGYDGGYTLYLVYYREETDNEYEKRMSQERKAKDLEKAGRLAEEERERQLYERLKEKFEKKMED